MDGLRIVIVHTRYIQPGGEDVVVNAEAEMLGRHGHEVHRFDASNEALLGMSNARAAANTLWNGGARAQLAELVKRVQPDVVHLHNTFPLLSPSVYYAFSEARPAVVQTLHNYRLVCPAATLMRNGRACEECVGRIAWPSVLHGCYRGSRAATLATLAMVQTHRAIGTWSRKVGAYIALTPFTRDVFVRGGVPAERIHVKPNFVAADPGFAVERGSDFLFVGRLEEGKGVRVLLEAWAALKRPPQLKIIGSGPLESDVRSAAAGNDTIEYLGQLPHAAVVERLKTARALVAPMIWYENFPLSLCEALAAGCPVITSDSENVRGILGDGEAGIFFRTGDPAALAAAVRCAQDDDESLARVARAGRDRFERQYSATVNYDLLMNIYDAAMQRQLVSA